MGTKGITNLPITAILKGKRASLYEQKQNIPVEGAPITTPAGNRPIKTMPGSYLFNNQPKSPIDQTGGGNATGSPVKQTLEQGAAQEAPGFSNLGGAFKGGAQSGTSGIKSSPAKFAWMAAAMPMIMDKIGGKKDKK